MYLCSKRFQVHHEKISNASPVFMFEKIYKCIEVSLCHNCRVIRLVLPGHMTAALRGLQVSQLRSLHGVLTHVCSQCLSIAFTTLHT
jgi:hypothetical protein